MCAYIFLPSLCVCVLYPMYILHLIHVLWSKVISFKVNQMCLSFCSKILQYLCWSERLVKRILYSTFETHMHTTHTYIKAESIFHIWIEQEESVWIVKAAWSMGFPNGKLHYTLRAHQNIYTRKMHTNGIQPSLRPVASLFMSGEQACWCPSSGFLSFSLSFIYILVALSRCKLSFR